MEKRKADGQECLQMRCGMASGPVVAGVLGTSVPKFSFWGALQCLLQCVAVRCSVCLSVLQCGGGGGAKDGYV